ncbi:site-specific DNA-methyltransferase [Paenirhodobacter populi]|uniref:site-specific DNA-methyltransferase n=1 Tax=Paenirhodobacter populi TaxID=2306993 RepID=UPI001F503E5F|nr:site-specific DNA-methyltransferase [Sinirhodobacter populi]
MTRDDDVRAADKVPYRLLEEVPELGYGDRDAGNMLIQGDNLEALKALLPYYAGQVKCIYIDPPYNTGSAFEHYDDNLEHSQWLAMMWPRLELLREFLTEDGSIWVSIDDREAHYLKVIMDEVFGRQNFLANFIWQKSYGGGSKAKWFNGLHEHILCYAKNLEFLPELWLPPDPEAMKKYYKYKDEKFENRGPYRLQPLATTSMDDRPNLRYPIILPNGREVWPEKQWQWSRERVEAALASDDLVFNEKSGGKITVSYKQYFRGPQGEVRGRKPVTILSGPYTQQGSYESMELFGLDDKFSFPKPEGLIETIYECCTNPGDLVLDSFLGSGTTAAVAQKMGRRYIGIEMGDHAVSHCVPRMKKVIEGEQGGISKAQNWQGGGGFRFYRLGPPVFAEDGQIQPDIRFPVLAAHIWFAETGSPWSAPAEPSPFLGAHDGRGLALLYNGILGDKSVSGGNVLTRKTLAAIRAASDGFAGPMVVYGERTALSEATLKAEGITFRQTPYDVKARK